MRTFLQFMEGTKIRITRSPFGQGSKFEAWLGEVQIGQAFLSNHGGVYLLDAIDIFDQTEDGGPNYQKQGYGTELMKAIKKYLKSVGATTLKSSNEGSGTVQMLDRVFGRKNVQHFHRGEEIPYEDAVRVMDVDFGYTGSTVTIR